MVVILNASASSTAPDPSARRSKVSALFGAAGAHPRIIVAEFLFWMSLYEILRRAKIGIFTAFRTNPKTRVTPNFTGQHGERKWGHCDPTKSQRRDNKKVEYRAQDHPSGRPQSPMKAAFSYRVNRSLAAIDDGNDTKCSQCFHSESHFEFANC
jgi:hypothetical protein